MVVTERPCHNDACGKVLLPLSLGTSERLPEAPPERPRKAADRPSRYCIVFAAAPGSAALYIEPCKRTISPANFATNTRPWVFSTTALNCANAKRTVTRKSLSLPTRGRKRTSCWTNILRELPVLSQKNDCSDTRSVDMSLVDHGASWRS